MELDFCLKSTHKINIQQDITECLLTYSFEKDYSSSLLSLLILNVSCFNVPKLS